MGVGRHRHFYQAQLNRSSTPMVSWIVILGLVIVTGGGVAAIIYFGRGS